MYHVYFATDAPLFLVPSLQSLRLHGLLSGAAAHPPAVIARGALTGVSRRLQLAANTLEENVVVCEGNSILINDLIKLIIIINKPTMSFIHKH